MSLKIILQYFVLLEVIEVLCRCCNMIDFKILVAGLYSLIETTEPSVRTTVLVETQSKPSGLSQNPKSSLYLCDITSGATTQYSAPINRAIIIRTKS